MPLCHDQSAGGKKTHKTNKTDMISACIQHMINDLIYWLFYLFILMKEEFTKLFYNVFRTQMSFASIALQPVLC